MSSLSRRTTLSLLRSGSSRLRFRPYSGPPSFADAAPNTPAPGDPKPKKPGLSKEPLPVPPTVFPAPSDPWDVSGQKEQSGGAPQYSAARVRFAQAAARLMGYNTKASTTIRETGRMMKGIVEAVELDSKFWYQECSLPPTYQTFFQVHLLYILTLLPRLRSLPAYLPTPASPVPEPLDPSAPHTAPTSPSSSSGPGFLSKPSYQTYPAEILNHFFELAETQMRRVLGRGERERVVKKYMEEMGQQWKGSGMAVDYAIGLSMSEDPVERESADMELASWLWRNLFDSRGLGPPPLPPIEGEGTMSGRVKELEMPRQLFEVVLFMRREMARLDGISDEDVLSGNIGMWGAVRQ